MGENHFNLFGTLAPHSKHWGSYIRFTFNHLEALKLYDSHEQIRVSTKNKNFFTSVWEYRLSSRGRRNWGVAELWQAIVSSRYLKSNSKGGCSGNLAEESGNAGVVILGGNRTKKQWFLKSKGTGEIQSGREWCNARAVKGQAKWKDKAFGTRSA